MNALVHAFRSSVSSAFTGMVPLFRRWQLIGVIFLGGMILLSALSLVYVKEINRQLLVDVEMARADLHAQEVAHDSWLLERSTLLRQDALVTKATAMGMVLPVAHPTPLRGRSANTVEGVLDH